MHSHEKSLSPLFRSVAGGVLVAWIAAFSLCTAHCSGFLSDDGHEDGGKPSCHDTGSTKTTHHDDGDSKDSEHCPSATLGCAALQSAWMSGKAVTGIQAPTHVLYLLAPLTLALNATPDDSVTLAFRQATPRDWVFTPEVCLGPAFRSLAPPVLL